MLIKPGTPTLRMSANNSQRGVTPRKFSRTIARERKYQIIRMLPPANGITSLHPAAAGPSAQRSEAEDEHRRNGDVHDNAADEQVRFQGWSRLDLLL